MNRLSFRIFLTFGLALYTNGQSEIHTKHSVTGYLYEKPFNGLEIPVADKMETLEEEIVTEEHDDTADTSEEDIDAEKEDEDHGSKLEYLVPKEDVSENEEIDESENGEVKNRKREFKNYKTRKNSNRKSDISLKRKNNLRRPYSQQSGDNLKRRAVTGSKQKKIRL